jgi:hypothetical protein
MESRRSRTQKASRLLKNVLVSGLLVVGVLGCRNDQAVRVKLQACPVSQEHPNRLDVQAQVAGPLAGLRYKWFSVNGSCEPQESDAPETVYRFAEGVLKDHITVEVWRDNRRIAESGTDVKFEREPGRTGGQQDIQIEITSVPPCEQGGPDTHADIAGRVIGPVGSNYAVVVYARAYDNWFIQPAAQALLPIRPDNTWTTWTHTGTSYAALVVRPGFEPFGRLDLLPQVGGSVLARSVVEGRK